MGAPIKGFDRDLVRLGRLLRPPVNFTDTVIVPGFAEGAPVQHFPADAFPTFNPVDWLYSHFAVGGPSPLHRLSGMQTAHMTTIAPHNGFTWHPHRSLEIYTWVLEGTIHHEDTTGGMGDIGPGELQRMFSGSLIYHQELNYGDVPVRVIQIWFAPRAGDEVGEPHYQQLRRDALPSRKVGEATVFSLIGDGSPMEQHMDGRLQAALVPAGGVTTVEAPRAGEDLFLYVVDGAGSVGYEGHEASLGLYDTLLARPEMPPVEVSAGAGGGLQFLGFYLPAFLGE